LYKGLDKLDYLTSDTVFNLTEQPKSLLIVGAGPIGCELGQGFARICTEVTMLVRGK
jgi:pyruvate/2-oxoglutarate dehydrogenase complex dihydrolipoamide dehydrogenase (E3) component